MMSGELMEWLVLLDLVLIAASDIHPTTCHSRKFLNLEHFCSVVLPYISLLAKYYLEGKFRLVH